MSRQVDLAEAEPGLRCVDCGAPAVGRRRNIDRQPSCLRCEAERQALIQILVEAAGPEPVFDIAGQRTMFGDRRE